MKPAQTRTVSVVVAGGGAAGWITANILRRKLAAHSAVKITLVESRRIGIIGVGEATVPTIKTLMHHIGITERELLARTQATFKHGILYRHWAHDPAEGKPSSYFHPFDPPAALNFSPPHWWLVRRSGDPNARYAEDVCPQARLAAAGKAPRHPDAPQFRGAQTYAYHIDAEALAEMLAEHGVNGGVTRVFDDVLEAIRCDDGAIRALRLRDHGVLEADFFVDCTGFSSLLISQTLGNSFESYRDQLFCDRAVALRVPRQGHAPIRPFTTATAKSAGWIWEIDLQSRSGIGYVYSSRHVSDAAAELELRRHIGPAAAGCEARFLKMRVGRSRRFWDRNVAAVGLSAGFIEPLESTGLYLIETGAVMLADALMGVLGLSNLDGNAYLEALASVATIYNRRMTALYEEIRDFIKIHYFLTQRRDTEFWRDNVQPGSAPESLLELLGRWKTRPPEMFDFVKGLNFVSAHNWIYVMLGMGWRPEHCEAFEPFASEAMGQALLADVAQKVRRHGTMLPDHHDYFVADSSLNETKAIVS